MVQHKKALLALSSIGILMASLVGCTKYVPQIEAVALVKQPEFVVRQVHINNPVVKVESTYQTVICSGCEKNDATHATNDVFWLKLNVEPINSKDDFIVADKHFDFDKAVLKGDLSKLVEIANRLKADSTLNLDIVGHTDSKGTQKYNMVLGQKRANAVKKWFLKQGIDSKRITATSKGESEPIASNKTKAGRSENRRAVITINLEP